jgi:anti-sigma B factor antagonist
MVPSKDDARIGEVRLVGEIDVFASPEVKAALVAAIKDGQNLLIIDFAKVSYIDSTGLGALVAALKAARDGGGSIAIVCKDPQIRRIFDVTGLVKVFGMFDDVAAARTSLRERFLAGSVG